MSFRKMAANAVEADDGTRIEVRTGHSVTYLKAGRALELGREIVVLPSGATGGSVILLKGAQSWSDGSPLTDTERAEVRRDLEIAAKLLGTKYRFEE